MELVITELYVHINYLFIILFLFHLEKQPSHLLSVFELMLLENVIVTHVIEGQSNHAINKVNIR
jgi:hypothetical protein